MSCFFNLAGLVISNEDILSFVDIFSWGLNVPGKGGGKGLFSKWKRNAIGVLDQVDGFIKFSKQVEFTV